MSKIAICIGVNHVKNFTPLQGATKGAVKFSQWAQKQGYEIKLFLDEDKAVVKAADIQDFIEESINSMKYSQMVVYFSGHGILRGPGQESWLLSKAGTKTGEFVNLTESKDYASTCPIPYVLFISDACRSLPSKLNQTSGGTSIFPIMDSSEDNVIDIFYATRPGSVAYEISGNSLVEAYGVFTESLVEYLEGAYLETIVNNDKEQDSEIKNFLSKYYDPKKLSADFNYKSLRKPDHKWMISATEVRIKLKEIVQNKAFEINEMQTPEIKVYHREQEYPLATFTDEQGKNLVLNQKVPPIIQENTGWLAPAKGDTLEDFKDFSIEFITGFPQIKIGDNNKTPKDFISEDLYKSVEDQKETGIQVIGEAIADFIVPKSQPITVTPASVKIDIPTPYPYGLLILSSGKSVPVAIIEGYVAQLIFKDGHLFTVNYTPTTKNYYTFSSFQSNSAKIMEKRKIVSIAANNGSSYNEVFEKVDFERLRQGFADVGSFLRIGKNLDPSLGLYAVYAFKETENLKKIKSVYRFMQRDNEDVIFDVKMLAGELSAERSTASFCPVMTTGWSYRRLYQNSINQKILQAANYLEPGLWTTFDYEGTKIITKEIQQNKV